MITLHTIRTSVAVALALFVVSLPAEARIAGKDAPALASFDRDTIVQVQRRGGFQRFGGPSFRGNFQRFSGPHFGTRSFAWRGPVFRGRHFRGSFWPYYAGGPYGYCRRVLVPVLTPSGRVAAVWVRRCPGWYPYSSYWW